MLVIIATMLVVIPAIRFHEYSASFCPPCAMAASSLAPADSGPLVTVQTGSLKLNLKIPSTSIQSDVPPCVVPDKEGWVLYKSCFVPDKLEGWVLYKSCCVPKE